MALSGLENTKIFAGPQAALTAFPFPYGFFAKTDLEVKLYNIATQVETTLTHIDDYTIAGTLDADGNEIFSLGGTITVIAAISAAYKLIIKRTMALTQETDFPPNSTFPEQDIEDALDKITMISQQLMEIVDRCIKLDTTQTSVDVNLPIPVAGYAIGWNPTADGLVNLADVGNIPVPIPDSYLDIITSPGLVDGTALFNLSNIPSGAGLIPVANHLHIHDLNEKVSFVANDILIIEDSADTNAKKRLKKSNMGFLTPPVGISNGGTGQTSANAALNALLPAQGGKEGYQLRSNGTNSGWSAGFQLFTASGLFYIPAGVTIVYISLVGGGGGGGGGGDASGGGGGSGAYAIKVRIPVTPAGINTVVVGAAGSAGGVNANGGDGGLSSYEGDGGMKIKVHGGSGGKSYANGGGGGAAGTVSPYYEMQTFAGRVGYSSAETRPKGDGGGSIWGLGGLGGETDNDNATAGTGYGSGGGGGSHTSHPGKAGAAGLVLVEW